MKIGFLHYTTPAILGGVESVMEQHAKLLIAGGHQVVVLAGRSKPIFASQFNESRCYEERIVELFDSLNPTVLELKNALDHGICPESFEKVSSEILEALREASTDLDVLIVHNVCSLAKNLALTAALKKFSESKKDRPSLIVWHHDFALTASRYSGELHSGYPWSLLIPNWKNVTHVVISEHRAQEFLKLVGLSGTAPKIIPNGIDLSEFLCLSPSTLALISRLNLTRASPLLILPVRITRRKNIEFAIRVVAALKKKHPMVRLLVTGSIGSHNLENATYFSELKSLRNSLHVESEIVFAADAEGDPLSREDISAMFRLADALLLPSLEEGFGLPILEAAASKTPIFCSDIAALQELLFNKEGAFSVSEDPVTVALLINKTLCSSPASRMFQSAKNKYLWSAIYEKHFEPLLLELSQSRGTYVN